MGLTCAMFLEIHLLDVSKTCGDLQPIGMIKVAHPVESRFLAIWRLHNVFGANQRDAVSQ